MVAATTWRSKRFELGRRLGAGGFGVVYEARDLERGGVVALKSLSRLDPRALLRFKREFRALADVDHPNLVAPFELLEESGEWFLTMPLVDGVDLLTWVRGRGPETVPTESMGRVRIDSLAATLDEAGRITTDVEATGPIEGTPCALESQDRLVAMMPQLVEGIAALHQAGLVHRDLKPSNVLVDTTGTVRILDFGLVTSKAAKDDAVLGTPAYMAPEQARGTTVDAAADWYAVGVMLFECLTGVLPFEGAVLRVIVEKQTRDAPRTREKVPTVPSALDDLTAALLSREPEKRPDGPEILRRLGTPSTLSRSAFPRRAREELLVGREEERESLRAALARAEAGAAEIVRVEGASGAGKSALVATFLREDAAHAHVLGGRCYEQERVPFIALDGAVDGIAELLSKRDPETLPERLVDLAKLFPVLGHLQVPMVRPETASAQEARRRAARALGDVLRQLSTERPVVLHVDDVQWGDEDSAALLAAVFEEGTIERVLLVLSHRSEAGTSDAFLGRLRAEGVLDRARSIEVGPLAHDDAVRLALAVLGRDDPEARRRAHRIATEADGHAMFVSELAHHASESIHPASLDAMIDTRVAALDPPSRALLEVVALAGAPLPRRVVERAANVGNASATTERSLRAGRFVRASGRRGERQITTYHDRIREVTVARIEEGAMRERHLAIADALEEEADPAPELLSRHLHAAGEHQRAMRHTLLAAERAMRALAFGQAVHLYRRALEHTPEDDPALLARLVLLGEALAEAGRSTEAAELFTRATSRAEGGEATALRRRAVEQWIRAGRIDEGLDALGGALRSLSLPTWDNLPRAFLALAWESMAAPRTRPPAEVVAEEDLDPRLLSRIDLLFSVGTALSLVEPIRGIAFTGRASRMALKSGEPKRMMRAYVQLAVRACASGQRGEATAFDLLARARELAARVDTPLDSHLVDLGESYVAFLCGRFVRCAELAFEAETHIAPLGASYRWELDAVTRGALKGQTFTGDLAAMRARVEPLLADAHDRRDLFSEVGLSIRFLFFCALMDDDPALATRILDDAIERWSGRKLFIQHWLESMSRIEIALYRGDGPAAHREMEERWPGIVRTQANRGQYAGIEARFMRGRAALAGGALGLSEKMARRIDREGADYGCAFAAVLRAGALHPTDPERSRQAFEEAADRLEAVDCRLFAAACRARAGDLDAGLAAIAAEGVERPEGFLDVYAPLPPV